MEWCRAWACGKLPGAEHLKKWYRRKKWFRALTAPTPPPFKPMVVILGSTGNQVLSRIGFGMETFLHDSITYTMCLGQGQMHFPHSVDMSFLLLSLFVNYPKYRPTILACFSFIFNYVFKSRVFPWVPFQGSFPQAWNWSASSVFNFYFNHFPLFLSPVTPSFTLLVPLVIILVNHHAI